MNFILYAIPVFFLMIAIELILEKYRQTHYYRINDAINSLSAGVLSRMTELIKALIPLTLYVFVFENFAIFQFDDSFLLWVLAFVLYDFCYYWNHRLGHEMSLLWAAHVVHHSSEEYNLTTALRQLSSSIFSWIFYLPLALLGIEPLLLVAVGSLNLIYQFWVHTRHVPKLGWFEWIFVTPSNHRVHHAQNRLYIDRNYGGVFIIWDRLFGTFQEELDSEPVVFGIRSALKSWNPLYANVQVYLQLCSDSWHTRRWQDKLRVWFGRTGWRPADVMAMYPLVKTDLSQFEKFDVQISTLSKVYCLLQHGFTTFVALLLLLNISALNTFEQVAVVVWVMYASFAVGMILENKRLAPWLEWLKHLSVLAVIMFIDLPLWLACSVLIIAVLSMVMLPRLHKNQFGAVNATGSEASHL